MRCHSRRRQWSKVHPGRGPAQKRPYEDWATGEAGGRGEDPPGGESTPLPLTWGGEISEIYMFQYHSNIIPQGNLRRVEF